MHAESGAHRIHKVLVESTSEAEEDDEAASAAEEAVGRSSAPSAAPPPRRLSGRNRKPIGPAHGCCAAPSNCTGARWTSNTTTVDASLASIIEGDDRNGAIG